MQLLPGLAALAIAQVMLSLAAQPSEAAADPSGAQVIVQVLFMALGGLGIFLLGMRYISEGMQTIAGNSLRKLIALVTDNRFLAIGAGVVVTCLLQSSSITTVLVVGFVNSGIMALHQAIGVIMGANIGTTITGWILSLDVGEYGLPILGLGAFFYLFGRRERIKYIAMTVLGLGMIFFGLELMKNGFAPIKTEPAFMEWFHRFDAHTYFGVLKCALVGCILTMIVQSSSATLGITIGLATTGVIPFETAAALVLGENIGTTITAYLASLGATTNAKRAAYAHMLFNVIGVLWVTAIFGAYLVLVSEVTEFMLGDDPRMLSFESAADIEHFEHVITTGIATVHTVFNVTNTILFLPFVRIFARALEAVVRPKHGGREKPRLTALDVRMVDTPAIAIERSRAEVKKMGLGVRKMMRWTRRLIFQREPNEQLVRKVFHREEVLDAVQQEVVTFLTDLLAAMHVSHSVAEEAREQLRVAHEFESISDLIATNLKTALRLRRENLNLADEHWSNLEEMHQRVEMYVQMIIEAYYENSADILSRASSDSSAITHRAKELRDQFLQSLSESRVEPRVSMAYTNMLQNYRRIRAHALNIAEAIAGEKS